MWLIGGLSILSWCSLGFSPFCSLLCQYFVNCQRPHRLQVFTSAHFSGNNWVHDFHFSAGSGTNHLFSPTICSITLSPLTLCSHLTVLLYVTQVPRHPGPTFTGPDITKGHPNLAGTPPGHAHSPALSQVSVATASPYRYPKGWETGGGVSSCHHPLCIFTICSFLLSVASIGFKWISCLCIYTCSVSCFTNIYHLLFIPKLFQVLFSV